jgi:lipopolysaccharide export LptBFGC system permease protein LptF
LTLEIISLVVTVLFAVVIAAKTGYINPGRLRIAVNVGVWVIFAYLVLNIVGNIASAASVENWIFAPITVVLALCALRLALARSIESAIP